MRVEQVWSRRGLAACVLWPISLLFQTLASLRRWLFRIGWLQTTRVAVPVIVVGNVVAGGSGKTPAVIAIVRHLQAQGIEVGVVSRGYGRRSKDCRAVLDSDDPCDVGDEPALIHRVTDAPVQVAARRVEAAQSLIRAHPQLRCIVSDDGLQHLALARDIEICTFDNRGIGNGWPLPAGPLRESWPRPCDLVLHTGDRPAFAGFRSRRALAGHAVRIDGTPVALAELATRRLVAVAGIARPQAFFDMLVEQGLTLQDTLSLPDHADFSDWTRPAAWDGALCLCTEKDAVKLWRQDPSVLAVPLHFQPEPAFFAALDAKLSSLDGFQAP